MTPDDKQIAENIAFRAANTVADRLVSQLKTETKMLADAVRQAALSEIEKTKMQIEAARVERRAEIEHHATTCPVKVDVAAVEKRVDAYTNKGLGAWAVVVAVAGFIGAVVAFAGPVLLKGWFCN